jgi:hypothetical protein
MTAQWSPAEEKALLKYLVDHVSKASDSGIFKMTTFEAAATHITHLLKCGAVKTKKMCHGKYNAVHKLLGSCFKQSIEHLH